MLHLLGSGAPLGAPQHCAHHHLQCKYKAIEKHVSSGQDHELEQSAIITIFTTIKIMTCGELVGCVESHGGAGCLPRVNSNAHDAHNTF